MDQQQLEALITSEFNSMRERGTELTETLSTFHGPGVAFVVTETNKLMYMLDKLLHIIDMLGASVTENSEMPDSLKNIVKALAFSIANCVDNLTLTSLESMAPANVKSDETKLIDWVEGIKKLAEQHQKLTTELDSKVTALVREYLNSKKH